MTFGCILSALLIEEPVNNSRSPKKRSTDWVYTKEVLVVILMR